MFLAPNERPGTIFAGEFPANLVDPVVRAETHLEILRMADVELPFWILQNISPVHIKETELAPERGLEPLTRRLTAGCSTIELLWNPSPTGRGIY